MKKKEMHPLKKLIISKGYSIRDFAYLTDTDHSTYYGIFNGKTKMPQALTLKMMAEVLQMPINEILEYLKWQV